MHDAERMPLWLADLWVDVADAVKGPDTQVERQLRFAEALAELLSIGFLSTVIADRRGLDDAAVGALAACAIRALSKHATFGDWAQIVRAGFKLGPRVARRVCGVELEPAFAETSAVGDALRRLGARVAFPVSTTQFLDALCAHRNARAHGRAQTVRASALAPALLQALDELVAALPAVVQRPLCHVEQAAIEKGGFVVHYRHLVGTGRRVHARHSPTEPEASSRWHRNLLVFWDGREAEPTPVPDWLARYDPEEHTLRFCQGTDAAKRKVVFHSWQRRVEPERDGQCFDALREGIAALGTASADSPATTRTEALYVDALQRALSNDGVVTEDERHILDGISLALGLSPARTAEIDRRTIGRLERDGGQPRRPAAPPRRRRGPLVVAVVVGVALAGAAAWWAARPSNVAAEAPPQSCDYTTDCPGDLECRAGQCAPFPKGYGGDAARAYKRFVTLRNAGDRAGFEALVDDPLECWFYVPNYSKAKFVEGRARMSRHPHVIKELLIISESFSRVTLQDRGQIGKDCHDTTVLMVQRDGVWKFSGEGSQRRLSQKDTPVKADCWERFGGPDAERRFGRVCPPVP